MRLALHIFRKDVRRLWWGIAAALLLQTAACFDISFANGLTWSALLMVAWATLLALAVHEDPLVGDRQFWITRPARWRVLLASKLLFALAVIHVPSFLADVAVLAAHGFRPWEFLGTLLTKQLALAAGLTVPTIALAAVLRSFAHMALAVIAIAGLSYAGASLEFSWSVTWPWTGAETVRFVLMGAIVGAGGLSVVWWQFARRRTWPSRLVGVTSVLAAELVLVFVSPVFLTRVRAAVNPTPAGITFRVRTSQYGETGVPVGMRYYAPPGIVPMTVPLDVSGIPQGLRSLYGPSLLDITAPGGEHMEARAGYFGRDAMVVWLPRRFYDRLKNAKVQLKGAVTMVLYRAGSSTSLPVGVKRAVPGMGRCSTGFFTVPGFGPEHANVQLRCESPTGSPLPGFVKFWEGDANRTAELDWRPIPGLAPLKLAEASFPLSPGDDPRPSGRFEITPDIPAGWRVVDLDLRDLRLRDYVLAAD